MDDLELIFSMLGEAATTRITKTKNPIGLEENKITAKEGGEVAGNARKELEKKIREEIVNKGNYLGIPEKLKRKKKGILDKAL